MIQLGSVVRRTLPMTLLAASVAAAAADRDLRFDSPGVLDLSARPLTLRGAHAIATAPLDEGAASAIIAAPALDEENPALPFSATLFGCKEDTIDCARAAERTRIDSDSRRVARHGKELVITTSEGLGARFVDWVQPTTKSADGDAETHYYLGRMAGSDYQRVEVQFGQDAPGSFLINPKSGKVAFVHNGGDVVALSPSGSQVADFALLDEQHPLRVAALDPAGPRVELQCALAKPGDKLDMKFKGWHDPFTLDLELDVPARAPQPAARLAVRLTRNPGGSWSMASPDAARVIASGYRCE